MPDLHREPAKRSCVRVSVETADGRDTGSAIVIREQPLTLLVPSHVVVLLEDGAPHAFFLDDERHPSPELITSPVLEKDHLTVLRLPSRAGRNLKRLTLPKTPIALSVGDRVQLCCTAFSCDRGGRIEGEVREVRGSEGSRAVVTDIPMAPGMSGVALLREGRLAGVCQGMTPGENGNGHAIAVPPTASVLSELRRIQSGRKSRFLLGILATTVSVLVVIGAGVALSWNHVSLAGIDVTSDARTLIAHNDSRFSIRHNWRYAFESEIRVYTSFSSQAGGKGDRIAVGTLFSSGLAGAVFVLDERGHLRWQYSVPDGECVYRGEEEVFDGFQVNGIYPADVDGDGDNELLVVFVHHTWHPCKLMVFDVDGEVLAEYWHPGYIRTLAVGRVGEMKTPLVAISASNNHLSDSVWNAQVLFAFAGLEIAGQGSPYKGTAPQGTELWYRVIENIDIEVLRVKCSGFDFIDLDGDGLLELRARMTDGRFYYLDAGGRTVGVARGDFFNHTFGDAEIPPLRPYPLRGIESGSQTPGTD